MCRRMRHLKPREIQGCDIAFDFSRPATLYDATSGGSLVAADGEILRAEDVSGNSRHATQGTANFKPLRKVSIKNGLDVARFDGSNDFLSAGDVANMGTSPVVMFAVYQRASGAGAGVFGKSRFGGQTGRWAYFIDASKVTAFCEINSNNITATEASASTAWRVTSMRANRTTGTLAANVDFRINATNSVSGSSYTEVGSNDTNTLPVYVGAYQNATGTGTQSGYVLNGDIGEVSKYSRAFTDFMMRRVEHAQARKWGIAT